MPYTTHGHWFGPGEPTLPGPRLVARCGGAGLCQLCSADVAAHESQTSGQPTNQTVRKVDDMASEGKATPLAVYDVSDKAHKEEFATSPKQAELVAWAEGEGIDLMGALRLELYDFDGLFAVVTEVERHPEGAHVLRCGQGHTGDECRGGHPGSDTWTAGRLPPRTIKLRSLPSYLRDETTQPAVENTGG